MSDAQLLPTFASDNDRIATDPTDIANTLVKSISFSSSTQHCSPTFLQHKARTELQEVIFLPTHGESYNTYITHTELKAIDHAHDSTPGPDSVHYQMLKHLPNTSLELLLYLFNHYWITDTFPSGWHEATIIPIPKPGG